MKYLVTYHAFGEITIEADSMRDAIQKFDEYAINNPSDLDEKIYSGHYYDDVEVVTNG